MAVLSDLEPKKVFKYFEEICGIPHGSGNTKKISDYLVNFADKHGLRYKQDEYNNVIIWKSASKGYEDAPTVIIQGHMDMVCEKDANVDIDFETDGLDIAVSENIIYANGTTLGGDDGIAVAYALAILDSEDISHPPLEVVITVDEEIGMLGAASLECNDLKGKIMLNIDSEDEGALLVSCAGGTCVTSKIPIRYEKKSDNDVLMEVTVLGITGGHSGMEIIKQGANANIIMGRTLYALKNKLDINIVSLAGGQKDNAIPRECKLLLTIENNEANISLFHSIINECNDIYKNEYSSTDKDIYVKCVQSSENIDYVMTKESTNKVVTALYCLPNGVMKMSTDISGLVQTSLNLGIMSSVREDNKGMIQFVSLVRSSVDSEKKDIVSKIECLMDSLGGTISTNGDYPAWEYKKDSMLRELMIDIYTNMYGEKPEVQAIHAGVECGLFSGKIHGLDCVSYGPQINDIHTTSERLYVDSVKRTWEYTLEVLKQIRS